jgi:hypothetical protein
MKIAISWGELELDEMKIAISWWELELDEMKMMWVLY